MDRLESKRHTGTIPAKRSVASHSGHCRSEYDFRLLFTVTDHAASGDTYARFRLSTAGGLAPTGLAADGEVEDYRVTINAAPTLDAITDLTIAEDAGLQNIDLTGITAGPGETQTLQVTAISSNPLD